MEGKNKHRFGNKRGQAVIELAITLPILILVLCAIIDFGWIFTNKMFITYSSREGARFGIVNATQANVSALITTRINSMAPSFLKDKITVTITFSDAYDIRAGDISVKVSSVVKALTPVVGVFTTDQSIPMDSVCVMKIE